MGDSTNSLGNLPVFSHPNSKSVFWYLDGTACVSVCVCCLLPCHWALRRVCLGLLYSHHSNIFTLLRTFLSLLFRLKSSSSFSLCSQDKYSSSLTIFVSFHWTLFRMSVSLVLRSLEQDSRHKMLPHYHWEKGKDHFPQPAGNTLFTVADGSNIFRLSFCL